MYLENYAGRQCACLMTQYLNEETKMFFFQFFQLFSSIIYIIIFRVNGVRAGRHH